MEFVIITGISGAGKTNALHVFEDIGYYCVDNIPSTLLSTLYTLCINSNDRIMKRVAVVADVRGSEKFEDMYSEIEKFKNNYDDVSILFFEARTETLIMRYKETRRRHPLAERLKDGSVAEAVEFEKALLTPIKKIADYNIDTSNMSDKQLRQRIMLMFMEDTSQSLTLTFMSFGFKYGIPLEADLIIDVRCLTNPYYIPELKSLTGFDKKIRDYVLNSKETKDFIKHVLNLLDFSVPLYLKEGKSELVVGIGCTGGKHRSVTIAMHLDDHFVQKGYKCVIQHRDVNK